MTDLAASLLAVLERAQKGDPLGKLIREALVLIESVLELLGEEKVGLSFNGGKDCTVLLQLYAAVLYARHSPTVPPSLKPTSDPSIMLPPAHPPKPLSSAASLPPTPPVFPASSAPAPPQSVSNDDLGPTHFEPRSVLYPAIKSIYITGPNPFPELDRLVVSCTELYGLDLWRFGGGMKGALQEWLDCGGGKGVQGVLVGTRVGDPNDAVQTISPTDPSWPSFLRIHPILHWTYPQIWDFLLEFNVPYCELYDLGYTSLGSTTNTERNPFLRDDAVGGGWLPAYALKDASQERAGRPQMTR